MPYWLQQLLKWLTRLIIFCSLLVGIIIFLATQPFISGAKVASSQSADPERLHSTVLALTTELPPRSNDPANAMQTAEYLFTQLSRYGKPYYQHFSVDGLSYSNVILKIDTPSDESIVIGAHYDVFGEYPGADDNASGVAGLMELARMFTGKAPPIDIILVAFALEEPPHFRTVHMGSAHHAAKMASAGVPPKLMISLEMIGYFSDKPNSQHFPLPMLSWLYSDKGNFISIIGRLQEVPAVRTIKSAFRGSNEVPAYSLNFPPVIQGMDFSDHRNYWANGIHAVMVTDTAFERNKYYHTAEDTAEKLDYSRMAAVVNGVFAAVFLLAK